MHFLRNSSVVNAEGNKTWVTAVIQKIYSRGTGGGGVKIGVRPLQSHIAHITIVEFWCVQVYGDITKHTHTPVSTLLCSDFNTRSFIINTIKSSGAEEQNTANKMRNYYNENKLLNGELQNEQYFAGR